MRRYKNLEIDGHKFRIQSINSREWRKVSAKQSGPKVDVSETDAKLIAMCVVDDNGTRIYSDSDAVSIADWDVAVALPLYVSCEQHCGLNRTMDDAVKNLDETPTPSST